MRHSLYDRNVETVAEIAEVIENMARTVATTREHLERSRALVERVNLMLATSER